MKMIMILIGFFLPVLAESAELACSLKGAKIYTINGVNNNLKNATKFVSTVEAKVIRSQIDKNPQLVDFQSIFNPSHGLANDALELLAQDLRARGITDNPWKYIGAALTGVQSGLPAIGLQRLTINAVTLAGMNEEINRIMYSPEQLSKADEKVVQELKGAVKGSLDLKKKVIVVAHSQGNSVTNLAMTHLKNDTKFIKDYKPYLGVLHVATPVNWRAIDNSQLIKLSSDLIVWNILMQPFSESANYQLVGYKDYSPVSNTLLRLLFSNDKDYAHHGMVETYLNDQYDAYPIGQNIAPKNMVQIFNENMRQIALKLEDNCEVPNIKIRSPLIEPDFVTGFNKINTYAGSLVQLLIVDDNENYDATKTTFNWQIRKVGHEVKFPNVNGATSIIPMSMPYNDFVYEVTVTATNIKEKKSTAVFNFTVKNNRPPTLSAGGVSCSWSDTSQYADGTGTSIVTVRDDSYSLDGYQFSVGVPYKATDHPVSITDNFGEVGTTTIANSCERTPLTYEVWGMCQLGGPPGIDCYFSPRDPKCDKSYQTGVQFNELRIYTPGSTSWYRGLLSHGYEGGPATEFFTDPNDPTVLISYPPGDLCTAGAEAYENPWIRIQ